MESKEFIGVIDLHTDGYVLIPTFRSASGVRFSQSHMAAVARIRASFEAACLAESDTLTPAMPTSPKAP